MAEAAVTNLIFKLTNFLENEVQFLRGAEEEAISVKEQLEQIRAFLRVADSLEESDNDVKVWVKQLREIAYDAEDALDKFTLLLAHDHGVGFGGFLCRMSCCIKNLKARYRITHEIRGINSRIKSVCDGHRRLHYKFSRAQHGQGSSEAERKWQDHQGVALFLDETELVGIEEQKKQLVGWLLEGASKLEVISVVGMGGLGKTTLVKQVYEDPEVKKHFMICVWITLSQSPKIEELLQDMLRQILRVIRKPLRLVVESTNTYWLKMIIKDLLQRMRYLIVIDDARNINEWDAIKHVLPNNTCGSRIIITTRNGVVAHTARRELKGKLYRMMPLPVDPSWMLFCLKTFQENSCPPHLEEICKSILTKCDGLPLAIVAISGVLATKDKRRKDEWDLVRRSLRAEIDSNDNLKNLKKVLSLSFNDLPYYLKSCFLHLSVFPEGHVIKRRRLIRLWIAEGFVEKKEGKTQEEVANEYFIELLNRSLIEVDSKRSDGRIKSCRIHSFLRDIITSKSSEHGFAAISSKQNDRWPEKVRRLSIQEAMQSAQHNRSLSQLRSLYMFGVEKSIVNTVLASEMGLLSILDLQNAPLMRFPVQIVDWYYLRYLSFRFTNVDTVPKSIGKLQNLETLDLKHTNVKELPIEILHLQMLRHLLVYRYNNTAYSCIKYGFKALRGIGALQSLQKLCYMEADDERNGAIMKELGKLTQLDRLAILKMRNEDGRDLCSSIAKLTKLQAISVSAVADDEIIDLQHLSTPPPFLQRIYLSGRLRELPRWIPSLHSIMKLHLKWSRLRDDPLVSLQDLPNLVHLELLQVYEGTKLCFRTKGFKKLKILGLDHFDKLTCVEVEKGAMPYLEKLIVQRCKFLMEIPSGIEYLTKLKVLEIFDMPDELVKKIMPDEQDSEYKTVAHIPEIYYGYWRDGAWDVQAIERSTEGNSCTRKSPSIRSSEFPPCWK